MKCTLTVCMGSPFVHQDSFRKYLLTNYSSIEGPVLFPVKMLHKIEL